MWVLPASGGHGVPTVFLPATEVSLMRTYVYMQPPVTKGYRLLNQALKSVTFSR